MIKYRGYKKSDEYGILSLWKKIFGSLLSKNDVFEINEKWWNWRIKSNPEGFPEFFLGVSENNKIVAHQMLEKFKISNGKRIYLSGLTMCSKDARGLAMLKLISDSTKLIKKENAIGYGLPNSNSLGIFERLGWKNIGDIPLLVRPLCFPFNILDIRKYKEIKVKRIEKFNSEISDFFKNLKNKPRFAVCRDSKSLNWKYSDNPLKFYEKIQAYKNGKISGYCVFRNSLIGGRKTGIILDIFAEDRASFNSLLNNCLSYFRKSKMSLVSCFMIKNNFYYNSLLKRGFIPVPQFLLPKKNSLVIVSDNTPGLLSLKNWHISYGDWDCF